MKRILVIDDEPTLVMIFEEFLSDAGYHVQTAFDGEDGLSKLNSELSPDLIMVDLKMPGLGGKEVITKLRQNPLFWETPVFIVTGSAKNDTDFPPEGSYQTIIGKPFRLEEVLAKVEEFI